jgi:hypothetical protein
VYGKGPGWVCLRGWGGFSCKVFQVFGVLFSSPSVLTEVPSVTANVKKVSP